MHKTTTIEVIAGDAATSNADRIVAYRAPAPSDDSVALPLPPFKALSFRDKPNDFASVNKIREICLTISHMAIP
ncbi:MAG TPA: hypothetical protein VL689_22755 [Paraburkholderia sp.]|jgi:hypothetical protein|nr:hypothetical protein [Paraburkholderia sp.]